ncbi:hypothetical protein DYH09_08595 [bacterium CPR1]|nr:hypothetical protein [bacterium CPR1]
MKQLAQYLQLPEEELCQQAKTMRRQVDRSLWNLGLYLIAIQQRKLHRARGCSGIIQFAVRFLDLAQQKAYELVRATTSLLETPLLAEAFRDGRVCWGKIREITGYPPARMRLSGSTTPSITTATKSRGALQ